MAGFARIAAALDSLLGAAGHGHISSIGDELAAGRREALDFLESRFNGDVQTLDEIIAWAGTHRDEIDSAGLPSGLQDSSIIVQNSHDPNDFSFIDSQPQPWDGVNLAPLSPEETGGLNPADFREPIPIDRPTPTFEDRSDLLAELEAMTGQTREQRLDAMFPESGYRGLRQPHIENYGAEWGERPTVWLSQRPFEANSYLLGGGNPIQPPQGGENILPARFSLGDRPLTIDAQGARYSTIPRELLPEDIRPNLRHPDSVIANTDEIAEAARIAGYDSITFQNLIDDMFGESTNPTTIYALLREELLRSRFAAADPRRRNEANLTAGIAGALGLGAASQSDDIRDTLGL